MKTKQPKTIEVKMLVPYGLIVALAIAGGSFITGWHLHQSHVSEVNKQAAELVTSLKVKK